MITSPLLAENEAERGSNKSEKLCNLTVTGPTKLCTLFVCGDATINGDLRVRGSISGLNFPITFNTDTGTAVPSAGILNIIGGTNVTTTGSGNTITINATGGSANAWVQGGNAFGAPGILGTLDNQSLTFITNGIINPRLSINSSGAVNINPPTAGDALTVTAANGAGENALVVIGGTGATAQTITAGGTQTALDILNGNINLTNSTSATTGNIFKAGSRFMHNYPGPVSFNTFLGEDAGNFTTIAGTGNTGIGTLALTALTSGALNTAVGVQSSTSTQTGSFNTAVGAGSLDLNVSGNRNTAVGLTALANTTVSNNTALGASAAFSITTGSDNIFIGTGADVLAGNSGFSNCIVLQSNGAAVGTLVSATSQIRIGFGGTPNTTCFIDGINGVAVVGNAVLVSATGQLGTLVSSRRYKENISSLTTISKKFMQLNPVKFNYKSDATHTPQYGLIAEEVENVFPELVVYNKDGEIESVKYHLLYAFYIKMIQDLQHKLETHEAKILELQNLIKHASA